MSLDQDITKKNTHTKWLFTNTHTKSPTNKKTLATLD